MATEPSCFALIKPSLPSLMATEMVGEEVSLVQVSAACVAGLPARSDTSAVMLSVPSSSVERSTDETE